MAATVNSPDSSRPTIEGSLRLATRAMPRACSRSVTQPPLHAPRIEQNNGIEARNPVLAMLMRCCISRYAGNQVWYIHSHSRCRRRRASIPISTGTGQARPSGVPTFPSAARFAARYLWSCGSSSVLAGSRYSLNHTRASNAPAMPMAMNTIRQPMPASGGQQGRGDERNARHRNYIRRSGALDPSRETSRW